MDQDADFSCEEYLYLRKVAIASHNACSVSHLDECRSRAPPGDLAGSRASQSSIVNLFPEMVLGVSKKCEVTSTITQSSPIAVMW